MAGPCQCLASRDGIMPHQPPHEDYQAVLQEVERLLRDQPQGLAS